jgi:putative transposase
LFLSYKTHDGDIIPYFWGGKLWTKSYFVETIGNVTEEVIRKYVQDQLIELDRKGI